MHTKGFVDEAWLIYSKVLDLRQVVEISGSIESEIGMSTGENEIPFGKRKTQNQDKTKMLENSIHDKPFQHFSYFVTNSERHLV